MNLIHLYKIISLLFLVFIFSLDRDLVPVSVLIYIYILLDLINLRHVLKKGLLILAISCSSIFFLDTLNAINFLVFVCSVILLMNGIDYYKKDFYHKNSFLLFLACIIILFFYLLFGQFQQYGVETRLVTIINDPNYSGVIWFSSSLLLLKYRRSFILYNSFGILLTGSRLFLLLTLISIIVIYCGNYLTFFFKHKKTSLLLIIICFLGLNIWFLNQDLSGSGTAENRLTSVIDESNKGRFLTNLRASYYIYQNYDNLFFSNLSEDDMKDMFLVLPHNSYLYLILKYGFVYTLLILVLLYFYITDIESEMEYYFILIYLIGSLFLHGFITLVFMYPYMCSLRIGLPKK